MPAGLVVGIEPNEAARLKLVPVPVVGDIGKVLGAVTGPTTGWVNPGSLAISDLTTYRGTATAGQTVFTIPGVTPAQIEGFRLGGVDQTEGVDWSWSGATVTYVPSAEAPAALAGEFFDIEYRP